MLSKKEKERIDKVEEAYTDVRRENSRINGEKKVLEDTIIKIEKRCEFLEKLVSHLTSKQTQHTYKDGSVFLGWQKCDGIESFHQSRERF